MSCANEKCLISINLAHEEIATVTSPEPLLILANRASYFSAFTEEVSNHFCNFVVRGDDVCISFFLKLNNLVIPWHYPIGMFNELERRDAN